VRISHPLENVSLPSDAEYPLLLKRVLAKYPKLGPAPGEDRGFLSEFRAAFQFVQHQGRRAELDRERSLGWWIDTARSWVSHRIGGFPINGAALVVAIIASGDVGYTDPEQPGFSCALQFGGGGIPAKDWWKRVLGGAILEPTAPLHPTPTPSPARVQQLAMGWCK
jgi:hypothetical protein